MSLNDMIMAAYGITPVAQEGNQNRLIPKNCFANNTVQQEAPVQNESNELNRDEDGLEYTRRCYEIEDRIRNAYQQSLAKNKPNEQFDYSNLPFNYINEPDQDGENKFMYYNYNHQYDPTLPITYQRNDILQMIEFNDVSLIQGNTGCGKTTQVPQMILDYYAMQNKYCNIFVTQPRRVAAMSIAVRVCSERNWKMGTFCGYQIGLNKQVKKYTRITYATIGILLQKLESSNNEVDKYTHIIIDEIHERDLNTDLVLLFLKVLKMKNLKTKIILMSATCDPKMFQEYYRMKLPNNQIRQVPILKCHLNVHEVETFYLDTLNGYLKMNLEEYENLRFDKDMPNIDDSLLNLLVILLKKFDQTEMENHCAVTTNGLPLQRGSVLIFLPGMFDIRNIEIYLKNKLADNDLNVLPLHSEISMDQQIQVFQKPVQGFRKVILSTTIAESSITVPDIKYVIDFCLTKNLQCNQNTFYTSLEVEWATKSNLDQRRGRAGRVSRGQCFRMITKEFFEELSQYQESEIARVPLDRFILHLKRFDFGIEAEPIDLFSIAIESPQRYRIEDAILNLKMAGALTLYKNKVINPNDGLLTYCGQIMSALPIDVRLSKLIFLGHAFGKLRDCVILAAALTTKSFFKYFFGSELETYKARLFFAHGSCCDYTAIINAYKYWRSFENTPNYFNNQNKRESWAKSVMLELRRLEEVEHLKNKLIDRLREFHIFCEYDDKNDDEIFSEKYKNMSSEEVTIINNYILKIIITGAMYPHYFITQNKDENEALKFLSDKDYKKTVVINGFDHNHGILYNKKIKELYELPTESEITISYEGSKAFLQYIKPQKKYKTKFHCGVYLAIAMKKYKLNPVLNKVHPKDAENYLKQIDQLRSAEARGYDQSFTKRVTVGTSQEHHDDLSALFKNVNIFYICIVDIINCGHFVAQLRDINEIEYIQTKLNTEDTELKQIDSINLNIGQLVCAPYLDPNDFSYNVYRAKILALYKDDVEVLFVDFGNKERVDYISIFELDTNLINIPFQAFECKLINIEPTKNKSINDDWSQQAKNDFKKIAGTDKVFKIEVYSIVDNIARVSLIDENDRFLPNIGDNLIKLCHAQRCEENLESKKNHEDRKKIVQFDNRNSSKWIKLSNLEMILDSIKYDESRQFQLKGPTSPLEIEVYALTRIAQQAKLITVNINRCSVNYVLVDDEPHIKTDRLLIADEIKLRNASANEKWNLNRTCLLPKIKGFMAMCCMLFAPTIELRANATKTHYSSVLCGLGFDKDKKCPIYGDHDMELFFDVEFVESDIEKINAVRTGLPIIDSFENSELFSQDTTTLRNLQELLQGHVLKLIKKERNDIVREEKDRNKLYKWNLSGNADYRDNRDKKESYFNIHRIVKLR